MTTTYQYFTSHSHPTTLSPILEVNDSIIARFDFLKESDSFDIQLDDKSFLQDLYDILCADDSFGQECGDVTVKVSDSSFQLDLTASAMEMVSVCENSIVDETSSFVLDTTAYALELEAILSVCENSFVTDHASFSLNMITPTTKLEGILSVSEDSCIVAESALVHDSSAYAIELGGLLSVFQESSDRSRGPFFEDADNHKKVIEDFVAATEGSSTESEVSQLDGFSHLIDAKVCLSISYLSLIDLYISQSDISLYFADVEDIDIISNSNDSFTSVTPAQYPIPSHAAEYEEFLSICEDSFYPDSFHLSSSSLCISTLEHSVARRSSRPMHIEENGYLADIDDSMSFLADPTTYSSSVPPVDCDTILLDSSSSCCSSLVSRDLSAYAADIEEFLSMSEFSHCPDSSLFSGEVAAMTTKLEAMRLEPEHQLNEFTQLPCTLTRKPRVKKRVPASRTVFQGVFTSVVNGRLVSTFDKNRKGITKKSDGTENAAALRLAPTEESQMELYFYPSWSFVAGLELRG